MATETEEAGPGRRCGMPSDRKLPVVIFKRFFLHKSNKLRKIYIPQRKKNRVWPKLRPSAPSLLITHLPGCSALLSERA